MRVPWATQNAICLHRLVLCLCLSSIFGFVGGCQKQSSLRSEFKAKHNMPIQDFKTEGLTRQNNDVNDDGKEDQSLYHDKAGQLVYAVRDLDFDGITDIIEYYEAGKHVRDEIDLDFDGHCDLITVYRDGRVIERFYSLDFQGKQTEHHLFDAQGLRSEIRRDSDGDGHYELIEYYAGKSERPYKTAYFHKGETEPYREQRHSEAAASVDEAAAPVDEEGAAEATAL